MDDYYIELLKRHLLPPLGSMMRNTDLTVTERGKAIKNLADGSLARTGTGAGWSAALGDQLQLQPSAAAAPPKIPARSRPPRPRTSRRLRQHGVLRSIRPARCSSIQGRFKRRAGHGHHPSIASGLAGDGTIKSRVKTLQALVPGGRAMNWPVLLGEAADYMMFLRLQVGVLQSVAAAIDTQQQQQQQEQQQQQQPASS